MFKRLLSLLLVAGIATAVGLFVNLPKLNIGASVKPQSISVDAKKPELICPGAVYVNGGASGLTLGTFTQSGSAQIAGIDGSSKVTYSASGFRTITGSLGGSKVFNAVQWQAAKFPLATGLAAANCQPGVNEGWLVAGDNSVGREALLILANPSAVDATVSLQLLGTNGPIQGTGLSGISAPAGKVTVLPLSAFAPKAAVFAVQVSSRGAALGIWLQQKTIRGVTPGGLDLVGVSPAATKDVEIPGLFIRTSAKLGTINTLDSNFDDTKPLLRVTAPGNVDATFTAQVQGANGASFGTVIQGTVPAGSTKDFVFSDLADGDYVVHVNASVPVLASARFSRIATAQPDLAWAVAVAPTVLDAGFTAAPSAISKLSVDNPGTKAGTVTLNGKQYAIAAGSNIVIALTAGSSYQISSDIPVAANQVIDVSSMIAALPIIDYRSVGGKLAVSVR